jgi:hypothetical protein
MGPVAVGTAGSVGQVGPCTLGRARGARKAAGSPKRVVRGAQKERVVRVVLHARWVACTRVDVGENVRVAQKAGAEEEVGTPTRARADHEEEESWTRVPGRGEGNAAAPVGAGDSPDKAHDGRTLVGCGAADGVADGEEGAESGNGALDGHRGERVDDEDDVAVGVVVVVVVDDYEVSVVVAPVAGPVVGAVVVAVAVAAVLVAAAVYALQALQRENFEGGRLRS